MGKEGKKKGNNNPSKSARQQKVERLAVNSSLHNILINSVAEKKETGRDERSAEKSEG